MALTPHAWIREKETRVWHHTRVIEDANSEQVIVTQCGVKDLEWDRAASMPGAGAQICRACMNAEEFDEERVPV